MKYKFILCVISILSIWFPNETTGILCQQREFEEETIRDPDRIPSCAVPFEQLKLGLTRPLLRPDGDFIPPWYNATLFKQGQQFAQKNFFAAYLGSIATFSMWSNNPLITPVLMATRHSDTPVKSNLRYLATMLHMQLYYQQAIDDSNGADVLIESLVNTRGVHLNIAKNYSWDRLLFHPKPRNSNYQYDRKLYAAIKKDVEASKISKQYRVWPDVYKNVDFENTPVMNQLSFAVIQFFLGGMLQIIPENTGISGATDEDLWGFTHLWAIIGYGIGLEDQFNLGLQPDLATTKEYYRKMYNHYMLPSLFDFTDEGALIHEAFFRGLVQTLLDPVGERLIPIEQFIMICFEDVLKIPSPNIRKTLPPLQQAARGGLRYLTNIMRGPLGGTVNDVIKRLYFTNGAKKYLNLNNKNPMEIAEKSFVPYNNDAY